MTRSTFNRTIWRLLKVGIIAAATWFIAIPQIPIAWGAVGNLAGIPILYLISGAVLALAALLAYAQLTRTMLDDGKRPGLLHTFGIIMTSLGINRVTPGGAAAGSLMTFRLLERAGVRRSRAGFAMATQSIGSAIILNVLLWLGLVLALPFFGFSTTYLVAIVAGAVLITASAAVGFALARRSAWLWSGAKLLARFVPRVDRTRLLAGLDGQSDNMASLLRRPSTMRRAVAWATMNWLLDITALWVFLAAFGVVFNPLGVIVAFSLANIAASLPITPGGLGVVDVTLVATLVGFGAAALPATLGVAGYRVFNYWLPIPGSALAYLSIRNIDLPTDRSRQLRVA